MAYEWNFNLVDTIFITAAFITFALGICINYAEKYLPMFISQTYRYGKMAYTKSQSSIVSRIEVPKYWFKHMYAFALIWSFIVTYIAARCFYYGIVPPEYFLEILDLFAGKDRAVQVDLSCAIIATFLMTAQSIRRFYETWFIQIFSQQSKINISHFLIGLLHYFGIFIVILGNADGFVRNTTMPTTVYNHKISFRIPFIVIFIYSWWSQLKVNEQIVNLRKNKYGNVVKQNQHLLPRGGFFEYVYCPHMLFEVLMYISICGIIPECVSWRYVLIWVVINQIESANLNRKWYEEKFPHHSVKAIIPYIY